MNINSFETSTNKVLPYSRSGLNQIEEMFLAHYEKNELEKANRKPIGNIQELKGEYDYQYYFGIYDHRGIRNRVMNLNFDILRQISERVAPIASVVNTRCSQIRPFGCPAHTEEDIGFRIILKDKKRHPDKQEEKEIEEIMEWFINTGFIDLPIKNQEELEREDKLDDVNERLTRELLVIDQTALVPRFTLKGELCEFRVIDGATIKRVNPQVGYEGDKKIRFVQELDGKVVETFTHDELIFDYMNKRADIRFGLYGYSNEEMCIDTITGFLYAMSYNNAFFDNSTQPKGFISFSNRDIDQEQLEELRRQWIAMFTGVKGLWKTPFLMDGAKWNAVSPSNQDMQFNEYLQVLAGWICAIYKIDPAEMGFRFNQAQQVLSENQDAKINYSKSRGLYDILSFLEKIYNKILLKTKWAEKYRFSFSGLKPRDKMGESNLDEIQGRAFKTMNEIRAEHDLKPDPYGDIIMNPTYIQWRGQQEMNQQQNQGQPQEEESQQQEEGNTEAIDEGLEGVYKSNEQIEFEILI